jgi:caa(3)-type oxidase subunit IV
MAHAHHDHAAHASEPEHDGHETHHGNYVRVWAILCGLLVVSVAGPFFGHPVITLITAFGIACVKAFMVAKHFMHITIQPRFVAYLIGTCLLFMLLFFAGSSPDVMKLSGTNWEKPAWKVSNLQAHEEAAASHHGHEGGAHE